MGRSKGWAMKKPGQRQTGLSLGCLRVVYPLVHQLGAFEARTPSRIFTDQASGYE